MFSEAGNISITSISSTTINTASKQQQQQQHQVYFKGRALVVISRARPPTIYVTSTASLCSLTNTSIGETHFP